MKVEVNDMGLKKIIGEAVKCTVYASTGIAMYKAMNNKLAEHEKIETTIQEERQAKLENELNFSSENEIDSECCL